MMQIAFGVFIAEGAAVWVYVVVTPDGTHRAALGAIASASVAIAILTAVAVPWVARQRWREQFSLAWTLFAGLALAVAASLDGGLRSPLLLLVLLPVTYAGLMFKPVAVSVSASLSVVEVIVMGLTETMATDHAGRLFMTASVTAGLGLLTWLSSVHRGRADIRTAALTHDLEVLATTDGLTGCLNHRAFSERLAEEVERAIRYGYPLSLVVADVDDFKKINDTYGHPAGDAALALAGQTLLDGSRRPDIVARMGGDEFALLLPATALAAAALHAQRVFGLNGSGVGRLTFSAGAASLDVAEPTARALLREADRALYHVKHTGGRGLAMSTSFGAPTRVEHELQSA